MIGEEIKAMRIKMGLRQWELAKLIGASQATICKIEAGKQIMQSALEKKMLGWMTGGEPTPGIKKEDSTPLLRPIRDAVHVRTDGRVELREVWEWLGISERYDKWIDRRIDQYGFKKDNDFNEVVLSLAGASTRIDHFGTPFMAFQLIVGERRNDAAEQARYYLFEKEIASPPKFDDPLLQIAHIAMQTYQNKQDLTTVRGELGSVKADIEAVKEDVLILSADRKADFMSVKGYAAKRRFAITRSQASHAGKRCSAISKHFGFPRHTVEDQTWGEVGVYQTNVLEHVFLECGWISEGRRLMTVAAGDLKLVTDEEPWLAEKDFFPPKR